MDNQQLFDVVARDVAPESSDVPLLLLDFSLRIRALNFAFEQATVRSRDELVGELVFDAFPHNPDDPQAHGAHDLELSFEKTLRTARTVQMPVLRYDIPDLAVPGKFIPKVWNLSHSVVSDHGQPVGLVHRAEQVTTAESALSAITQAIQSGHPLSAADQLHTLAPLFARLRQPDQVRALAEEVEQLRRAVGSRDIIGQAKGIIMEKFGIGADAAFRLLVKLSQDSNTPLVDIAAKLVQAEHPAKSDA